MAGLTIEELTAIRDDYKFLDGSSLPEVSAGQCIYKDYTFASAIKYPCYKIPDMTNEEMIKVYQKWTDEKTTAVTEEDLFDLVACAINVKSKTSLKAFIDGPKTATMMCEDWITAKPSKSHKVPMTGSKSVPVPGGVVPPTSESAMDTGEEETTEIQAAAAGFLCAWLTRYAVKSPSPALSQQYDGVINTFTKFYQKHSSMLGKFKLESSWILCLRNAFDSFARVKNTLVIYVAFAETQVKKSPNEFNLLRYLFFQNLEFMGMHVYCSVVNIINKASVSPGMVLSWLRMRGAEKAIDEVCKIMKSLDNGMINGGEKAERLWKYARLLDPGFFNRLQTTYSVDLMATLAYIEIKMGISSETGYNSPLNIFAIQNNKSAKDVGKMKAEAFMECINSVIAVSKDASAVDKIYARKHTAVQMTHTTTSAPSAPKRTVEEAEPSGKSSKLMRKGPPGSIPPPPSV